MVRFTGVQQDNIRRSKVNVNITEVPHTKRNELLGYLNSSATRDVVVIGDQDEVQIGKVSNVSCLTIVILGCP